MIETRDEDSKAPYISVDGSGNGFVVWEQKEFTVSTIYTNRLLIAGGWGLPVLLESSGESAAGNADIAADSSSNAVAIWAEK